MKLSDTQKKWALTATLATVLSFNLVMSLTSSNAGYGTANLASADSESRRLDVSRTRSSDKTEGNDNVAFGEFKTVDGKRQKVMFEKVDGSSTRVHYGKETDGTTCYTCGDSITVNEVFSKNVNDLVAIAVAKQAEAEKSSVVPASKSSSDKADTEVASTRKERERQRRAERDEEDNKDDGKKALNDMVKDCKKEHKKSDERLECISDGFVSLLSKAEDEFDRATVFKVFSNEIGKPLVEMMRLKPGSERYELAVSIVSDIASSIPEDYNYIRQSLAKVNAKVVAEAERNTQETFNAFKQADQAAKANPTNTALREQANTLGSVVNLRQSQSEQLANDLGMNLRNGYADAVSNSFMDSSLADQYMRVDYAGTVNNIIQGMRQSALSYAGGNIAGSNFQIPTINIGEGSAVTLSDGTTLIVTAANTVNPALKNVVTTTTNGIRVIPNNITAQINSSTPMIQPGQTGQNTVQIVSVPGTAQPGAGVSNRAMPAIRN
jgi:hypothetical protein